MSGSHAMYRLKELMVRIHSSSATGMSTTVNNTGSGGMYHSGMFKKERFPAIPESSLPDLKGIAHDSTNSRLITKLKFFLGYEVCPVCGSNDIIVRGFEGVNQRYHCQCCGIETAVPC